MNEPNLLEYLIIDSGPIIRGHGRDFFGKAKRYLTVPEVYSEIRDAKARELLLQLPFELEVKEPSKESIKEGKYFNYFITISNLTI